MTQLHATAAALDATYHALGATMDTHPSLTVAERNRDMCRRVPAVQTSVSHFDYRDKVELSVIEGDIEYQLTSYFTRHTDGRLSDFETHCFTLGVWDGEKFRTFSSLEPKAARRVGEAKFLIHRDEVVMRARRK